MQYLASLFTFALQSIGQIIAVLLGWIVTAYFGRVPVRQKYIFSAMGAVSLLWAAMALILTSHWVRRVFNYTFSNQALPFYLRLIIPLAGIGWVLLPLVNSILAIYYHKTLTKTKFSFKAILRGYKYTPGFALAMVLMLISLPLILLPPLLKGWQREHLTIMIEPGHFDGVLASVVKALKQRGFDVTVSPRALWWRSPQSLLMLFAHDLFGNWTKTRARLITGTQYQVVVHPTDLVIEGAPHAVVKVRAELAKQLTFSDTYFTWDGEAHRLETSINLVRQQNPLNTAAVLERLAKIETELDAVIIPFAEWERLYRQILQLRVWSLEADVPACSTYLEHTCRYYVEEPMTPFQGGE
ncbi:MAG: hypothetical protein M0Z55_09895 [Peptococcaceae bacterium]|nr:hypothetical protein [Peptococcaceae bacterium]